MDAYLDALEDQGIKVGDGDERLRLWGLSTWSHDHDALLKSSWHVPCRSGGILASSAS